MAGVRVSSIAIAAAQIAVVDNTFSLDRPVDVTIGDGRRLACARRADAARASSTRSRWARRADRRLVRPLASRRAASALEAGHRWTRAPSRPWLRAGYLWASGDGDRRRRAARHVLPDAALVAEVRAVVGLRADEPPRRVRAGVRLNPAGSTRVSKYMHFTWRAARDLWYQGSGATASKRPVLRILRTRRRRRHLARHRDRRHRRRADQEALVGQRLCRHHVRRRRGHELVHRHDV